MDLFGKNISLDTSLIANYIAVVAFKAYKYFRRNKKPAKQESGKKSYETRIESV